MLNSLRQALTERMTRLSLLHSLALNCDFTDKTVTAPGVPQTVHQIPDGECRVQAQVNVIPEWRHAKTHLRMKAVACFLSARLPPQMCGLRG